MTPAPRRATMAALLVLTAAGCGQRLESAAEAQSRPAAQQQEKADGAEGATATLTATEPAQPAPESQASAAETAGEVQAEVQPTADRASPAGESAEGANERPSEPASTEVALADPAVAEQAAENYEHKVDRSFDDLKFDIEKGAPFKRSMLPKRITSMGGKRMKIRGYILPTFQQTGLTQFVLVRDNMECCFGPGAALYDCILVDMVEGKSANFSIRPVAVEGVFNINEVIGPDGKHLAIYHLKADSVR